MKAIIIDPTEHSARVEFNPNGRLLLEGRSLPENVAAFYSPLIDFLQNIEADEVTFDMNLEYFNTATSKKLLELLKSLDTNNKVKLAKINWHYEEGDDDSLEMAEIYEEKCFNRCKFTYVMHAETISLIERVNFIS